MWPVSFLWRLPRLPLPQTESVQFQLEDHSSTSEFRTSLLSFLSIDMQLAGHPDITVTTRSPACSCSYAMQHPLAKPSIGIPFKGKPEKKNGEVDSIEEGDEVVDLQKGDSSSES